MHMDHCIGLHVMGKLFFLFLFTIFNKSIVERESNLLNIFVEDTIIAIMICLDFLWGMWEIGKENEIREVISLVCILVRWENRKMSWLGVIKFPWGPTILLSFQRVSLLLQQFSQFWL